MTKPITCEESRTLWSAHLDGELAPESSARLTAHLDRCASCRALLESLVVGDRAVRRLPAAELGAAEIDAMIAGVWARVDAIEKGAPAGETAREPLRADGRTRPLRLRQRLRSSFGAVLGSESAWMRFAQVAATLLVMAVAGRLIWDMQDAGSPLSESMPAGSQAIRTPAGERLRYPAAVQADVDGDRSAAGEDGAREFEGVEDRVVDGLAVEPRQKADQLGSLEAAARELVPKTHASAVGPDAAGSIDKIAPPQAAAPVARRPSPSPALLKFQAEKGATVRTTQESPVEAREAPRQRLRHLPPPGAAIDAVKDESAPAPQLEMAVSAARSESDAAESPARKKVGGAISAEPTEVDARMLDTAWRSLLEAESRAADAELDAAAELRKQLDPFLATTPAAFQARVAFFDLVLEAERQRGAVGVDELRARLSALDAIAEGQASSAVAREAALWSAESSIALWRGSGESSDCTTARQAIERVLERYAAEPRAAPCRSWLDELDC